MSESGSDPMRVLMVGAGGVGDAAARIAVERDFFEAWVVADHDLARAERTVAAARERRTGDERFSAAQVDASDADAVSALAREVRATHVFNAVDPRFVMPIFTGALAADADYLDMAMSLSVRHPEAPYEEVGVKLGDEQFARAAQSCGSESAGAPTSRRPAPRCRPSPSRRSSTSPRASGRSSACTWSTRRCSSCLAGSTRTG